MSGDIIFDTRLAAIDVEVKAGAIRFQTRLSQSLFELQYIKAGSLLVNVGNLPILY